MDYKCIGHMNKELTKKIMDFLRWKLKHNDENIDYIQIAKYLEIDNRQAEEIINNLHSNNFLKLYYCIHCPECGHYTIIDKTHLRDILECENIECRTNININNLPPKSDYFFVINQEPFDEPKKCRRKNITPFYIKDELKHMTSKKKIKVFLSYSHEDEKYKLELDRHLAVQRHNGVIETWNDRKLVAGSKIHEQIDDNLSNADLIILLVSSDFFASNYCYENEMKKALEHNKEGNNIIIPVILRECDWLDSPLSQLAALPTDGKPVSIWDDKDAAYMDIVKGVKDSIQKLLL